MKIENNKYRILCKKIFIFGILLIILYFLYFYVFYDKWFYCSTYKLYHIIIFQRDNYFSISLLLFIIWKTYYLIFPLLTKSLTSHQQLAYFSCCYYIFILIVNIVICFHRLPYLILYCISQDKYVLISKFYIILSLNTLRYLLKY